MSNDKFSVTFNGFDSLEQANAFLNWYEGAGEQDVGLWLENSTNLRGANVDLSVPYVQDSKGVSCTLKLSYSEDEE